MVTKTQAEIIKRKMDKATLKEDTVVIELSDGSLMFQTEERMMFVLL